MLFSNPSVLFNNSFTNICLFSFSLISSSSIIVAAASLYVSAISAIVSDTLFSL